MDDGGSRGCLSVSTSLFLTFCIFSAGESHDGECIRLGWLSSFLSVRVGCLPPYHHGCLSTGVIRHLDTVNWMAQDTRTGTCSSFFFFLPLFLLSKRCGFGQSSGSVCLSSWSPMNWVPFPWITMLAKRHPLGMENSTHFREGYD